MTVCIAAKANDGKSLVLVADQMATMNHIAREAESAHKILPVIDGRIYVLIAGSEFFAKEIYKAVMARKDEIETVEDAKNVFLNEYIVFRLTTFQTQFLSPRGLDLQTYLQSQQTLDRNIVSLIDQQMLQYQFGVSFTVAGLDTDGQAHIYDIEDPGLFGEQDSFTSVGTGATHASNSLLARGFSSKLDEIEALYLAFEAKKRSEVAPGVGIKTDLILLNSDGSKTYSEEELKDLTTFYKEYVAEEREALSKKLMLKFNSKGGKDAKSTVKAK